MELPQTRNHWIVTLKPDSWPAARRAHLSALGHAGAGALHPDNTASAHGVAGACGQYRHAGPPIDLA